MITIVVRMKKISVLYFRKTNYENIKLYFVVHKVYSGFLYLSLYLVIQHEHLYVHRKIDKMEFYSELHIYI